MLKPKRGFGHSKDNVVHRQKAEIESLKTEIENMRHAHHRARFAREIGENIMIILANKPFSQWPEIAKIAFKHAQDRQETTAYLYKQNLPEAVP